MFLQVPGVLTTEQVVRARQILDQADWVDGRVTSGHQSVRAKDNIQLPEDSPEARQLADMILTALERNPLFVASALPLKVVPPLFNRYREGQSFGMHIDNAIRQVPGTGRRLRTDLSATLFFSGPEEYEGGELVVEAVYGTHSIKLPAGDMVLYPATSLHHVRPVTSGTRLASFFWIQSMVRDQGQRDLLFDLDLAIQQIHRENVNHSVAIQLAGIYHNLLRQWADAQ